jgi:hypothetical protein
LLDSEAPADPALAQLRPDPAGVGGCSGLGERHERAIERFDAVLCLVGFDLCSAEILSGRCERERALLALQEIDRRGQVLDAAGVEPARVRSNRGEPSRSGVLRGAALGGAGCPFGELVILDGDGDGDGDGDTDHVRLIGDVHREDRQDPGALILAEGAELSPRGARISRSERL